ncbi:MAG: Co2+/Mg2+ efflux protein ApaG [Bacteroidetes bacterium]|nr:Co2+/Mg2+ efflux protein ApaG [Bacteroidota bacterium]
MSSFFNSKTTEDIRVMVRTHYLLEESSPKHQYYVFAYQVEITNQSPHMVQLISREWHIIDGFGQQRVVKGDGVIGKQPIIAPGETYCYSSGSHFESTIGKMEGYYFMQKLVNGQELKIEIPPFVMQVPFSQN